MFQNITETYTQTDATIEILLMLLGAFVIGFIFGWILKSAKTEVIYEEIPVETYTSSRVAPKTAQAGDNLQLIDGITPEILSLLQKNNITSFDDILTTGPEDLSALLVAGGISDNFVSPITWGDQARLAQAGKYRELEEYQHILQTATPHTS